MAGPGVGDGRRVAIDDGAGGRGAVRAVDRGRVAVEPVERERFVEVGPGKVLTGLVGRITDRAKAISVQSPADFEAARTAIDAARAS